MQVQIDKFYLDIHNQSKRIAITDWEDHEKVPIDAHNKVWADEYFMYVKIHSKSHKGGGQSGQDEWRRYAIAEYIK